MQKRRGSQNAFRKSATLIMIHFLLIIFSGHSHSKTQCTTFAEGWLVMTLIVQLYCNSHIAYYKWKHYQEEKSLVISIRLRQPGDVEQQQQPDNSNPLQQYNTTTHNKILAEVKQITCLLLFLSITIVSKLSKSSLVSSNASALLDTHPVLLFIYDLGSSFLMLLLFPILFYLSHAELRQYWWERLSCTN